MQTTASLSPLGHGQTTPYAPLLDAWLGQRMHSDALYHAHFARRFRALAKTLETPTLRRECKRDAERHERHVRAIATRIEVLLRRDAAIHALAAPAAAAHADAGAAS